MFISIIIPTYKPQSYIEECLLSLENQSLDKTLYEVIIVLNGEKEPYYSYIKSFISHLTLRIQLLYTSLASVSNARNIAIQSSQGSHICFIDDDDYVSEVYLEELFKIASKNIVPLTNIQAFEIKDNHFIKKQYYISEVYNKLYKPFKTYNILQIKSYMSVPVLKLIPKSSIGTSRFNLKFKNGEDSIFMFLISKNLNKFQFTTPTAIYYRRIRTGSAVTTHKTRYQLIKISFAQISEYTSIYLKSPFKYNFLFFITRILAAIKNTF